MELYTIPEWDTSAGSTNFATTWRVYSDINASNLIYEKVKSEDNINTLLFNLVIPPDTIYYITALRHLKDSDGNELEYDNVLGPNPILPKNTDTSLIANDLIIDTPYIVNINIDSDNGMDVILNTPTQSSLHDKTCLIISDIYDNELYSIITDTPETTINIPIAMYNFTTQTAVIVEAIFISDLGIISKVGKRYYSYSELMYNLVGNYNKLNPNVINKFIFEKANGNVTLNKATLLDMNGIVIDQREIDSVITPALTIVNNIIELNTFILEYDKGYYIRLNISYLDSNGNNVTTDRDHYLTTQEKTNQNYFNKKFHYDNEITLTNDSTNMITDASVLITEQNIYGKILTVNNNNIVIYKYDRFNNNYTLLKTTTTTINGNMFKIKFISKNKLIVAYNDNGVLNVNVYSYNNYTDNITLINSHTNLGDENSIYSNNFILINNKLYIFMKTDSDTTITIKYINILNNTINDYGTISFPVSLNITNINVSLINKDTVLILPTADNAVFTYMYNFTFNTITKALSIPDDFKNKQLIGHTLINNSVLYTKYNDNENSNDYLIIDTINASSNSYKFNYDYTNNFTKIITHRHSSINMLVGSNMFTFK